MASLHTPHIHVIHLCTRRPRSHRLFLGHMDTQACIRTFMCSCQEALRAEQQQQQQQGEGAASSSGSSSSSSSAGGSSGGGLGDTSSGSSSPGGSFTASPPWVWKGEQGGYGYGSNCCVVWAKPYLYNLSLPFPSATPNGFLSLSPASTLYPHFRWQAMVPCGRPCRRTAAAGRRGREATSATCWWPRSRLCAPPTTGELTAACSAALLLT